ncbi:hypothetical protein GQ44DRAFT_719923 [Phaeosphaeriaceae sp. PMI808]|nr:hypothetical protein GQ44DRAFT_719923 [Phaeosphaeriaceae sp. PMI808]
MIFGGLELAAGGYLLHRHYKHKSEKKRQEVDVEARRHNTFPGARPAGHYQHAQPHPQPVQHQYPVVPQQKYACYATPQPQLYHHHASSAQPYMQPRPGPPYQSQTFDIPRRPVPQPQQKPEIIIQPSLQRADSCATLSRMPIANGHRPQNMPKEPLEPHRLATGSLQPATQHGVYGNAGFSISTPALGATPTSPGLTYTMATTEQLYGRHTVDDNWETYGSPTNPRLSYAATEASTQLGEHGPPPPYAP